MTERIFLVLSQKYEGKELDNKMYSTLKANCLKFLIHAHQDLAETYLKANKTTNTKQTELLHQCLRKFISALGAQHH